MEMHDRTFKKLHANLITLAETVQKKTVEGHIVFEWPAFNTWWHRREIKRMIEMFNLKPGRMSSRSTFPKDGDSPQKAVEDCIRLRRHDQGV